jgi:ABC-2 type transport system ATP-binding protein
MTVEYAIETEQLTKVYRSRFRKREVRAVDGISLRIRPGATFGLLGPNGAGKTTFVKMLLSAVQPTSGTAQLFGQDARLPRARAGVGYLPENHRFPTYFTGGGMLDFYAALSGMPGKARRQRRRELLELVGLERWEDTRIGKYSKGMLQRLGLAQALMHSPQLLVLDEPSDGVDPVGRIQIREILKGLEQQGVTIFINSHLLVEVELFCRDVAILHRGRVAAEGSVEELTAAPGYRVTVVDAPEEMIEGLGNAGVAVQRESALTHFIFPSREDANSGIDALRSRGVVIEGVGKATTTLEEVFLKVVNG